MFQPGRSGTVFVPDIMLGGCPRIDTLLRKIPFGQISRSFSLNSQHYSPQTIEKSDSKGLSLATASILGQPPSDRFCGMMSGINSMPDLCSDRRDLAFAVLDWLEPWRFRLLLGHPSVNTNSLSLCIAPQEAIGPEEGITPQEAVGPEEGVTPQEAVGP